MCVIPVQIVPDRSGKKQARLRVTATGNITHRQISVCHCICRTEIGKLLMVGERASGFSVSVGDKVMKMGLFNKDKLSSSSLYFFILTGL